MLVLSISSLKGGVGKTSVALGLASAAQSRGIPTLVVDMDPQADASTGLDIPISTPLDIADVLAAPKSKLAREAIVPSGWTEEGSSRLDVIPGSPRAAEFDRPSLSERYLRRLRDALERVSDVYRLVIIDCPPSLNGLTRSAWTASNRVLVVTEPGLFSVAAADRALRASDELRKRTAKDLQPLGIALNRVRPSSREHSFRINELKDMFGPLVVNPPLPERTVLQQAQGSARPIHQWPGRPASELARAFDKILDRALRSENIRGRRSASASEGADAAGDHDSSKQVAPSAARADDRSVDSGKSRSGASAQPGKDNAGKSNSGKDAQPSTASSASGSRAKSTAPADRASSNGSAAAPAKADDKQDRPIEDRPTEKLPAIGTPAANGAADDTKSSAKDERSKAVQRPDGSFPSRRDLR